MIRTLITPHQQNISILVPQSYVGKKIEIIAFVIDEGQQEQEVLPINTMAQFWGAMSNETAKNLQEQTKISRNEWDKNI